MALKMSEPDYLLQSFGICAYSLKNGLSTQMIKDAALKINKLSQSGGSKTWLIDISNQLLPVIEDDKFSPIWLVLLEGLSGLCHQEEVQNVYSQINKKHAKVFVNGSLPKEILHKLWLSHLPCLEFAVVSVVEHVCANQDLPDVNIIHDTLIKSCVVRVFNFFIWFF
uniref:Uncharacterized protein n=1 Tax=Arion vulgaris TaxID=1028688 RepID=A0A0B7B9E7_9EUPU